MTNTELPFDPVLTGQAFAGANDSEQAKFFNEMGRFMEILCRGDMDRQLCYVADHLNFSGQKMITNLAAFIEIKTQQEKSK